MKQKIRLIYFSIAWGLFPLVACAASKKHENVSPLIATECTTIKEILSNKEEKYRHSLENHEIAAGTDIYPNLDVNSDGVIDRVIRNRGYGNPRVYSLEVLLSSGEQFVRDMSPFFLIQVSGKVFAFDKEENVYLISRYGINNICELQK